MPDVAGRLTLWGVEIFLATVEEGSVTAAAQRLGASPSSVSQQLTNLETALGTELIDRRSRPAALTPAGAAFHPRALAIRSEAEQARLEIGRMTHGDYRLLRLGMIEDFDAVATPALLQDMADDLSSAQFLLETGASHLLLDGLEARTLDLAVCADFGPAEDWMELHPILVEPFVIVTPKGFSRANVPDLPQLLASPYIQYTSRHQMGRVLAGHLARHNVTLPHRYELDSYHAILALVAARVGWTILTPLGVAHAARFSDQIDMHPLPFAKLTRSVSLIARRELLGDVPAQIAARLARILQERVISPALVNKPWLKEDFRLTHVPKD